MSQNKYFLVVGCTKESSEITTTLRDMGYKVAIIHNEKGVDELLGIAFDGLLIFDWSIMKGVVAEKVCSRIRPNISKSEEG